MNANGKRSAWLLGAALVLIGLGAGGANADPSEACRNLALQFGSQPSTLDTGSLAALSSCVTEEIQARAAAPPPPASNPQGVGQTPAGQVSGQDDGTWPAPPVWRDNSIDSRPWDRYDK